MGNLVHPNGRREEGQNLSLAPDAVELNGEDALMRNTNLHDPPRQGERSSMSRCPMHTFLEQALDALEIQEPDFHHTHQPKPDLE